MNAWVFVDENVAPTMKAVKKLTKDWNKEGKEVSFTGACMDGQFIAPDDEAARRLAHQARPHHSASPSDSSKCRARAPPRVTRISSDTRRKPSLRVRVISSKRKN